MPQSIAHQCGVEARAKLMVSLPVQAEKEQDERTAIYHSLK